MGVGAGVAVEVGVGVGVGVITVVAVGVGVGTGEKTGVGVGALLPEGEGFGEESGVEIKFDSKLERETGGGEPDKTFEKEGQSKGIDLAK